MEMGWPRRDPAFERAADWRFFDLPVRDGLYLAVFRTRLGEQRAVTSVMDGLLRGAGPALVVRGSIHGVDRSLMRAVVDLRVRTPARGVFGAADQLSLLLLGPSEAGNLVRLQGALPGLPEALVSLELRRAA